MNTTPSNPPQRVNRLIITGVILLVAFVVMPWYTFWIDGQLKQTLDKIYGVGITVMILTILIFFFTEMGPKND